jgi:hypothetical protein
MKMMFASAAALALLVSTPALAQTVDGTWKADVNSAQAPKKPEVYLIKGGSFTCKTCTPAFTVKADGQYHPVTGSPYFDQVAIQLNSNGYTETDSKKGKVVATSTTNLSADAKTATIMFTDSSASTTPVKGTIVARKVEAGPAGSHPASGSWQTLAYSGITDNGLTVTYKTSGDTLTMSTPSGQSYSAKLGGPAAPYKGDPGTETISVKMSGKSLVETGMRGGKAVYVVTSTPSADGKSISVVSENKLKGTSMTYSAKKQ